MALLTRTRRWLGGSIFHLKARDYPKHVENSDRGDRMAKRRGKRGTDLDILITVADPHCPYRGHPEHVDGVCHGHVVNTHWPRLMLRDGFRDPKGLISRTTPVKRMTLPEILRLVAGRWPRRYHVRTLERALRHCAKLGRVAVLEPKGDPRFDQLRVWEYIAKTAEAAGCEVSARALPENASALVPAHAVGIDTWTI